MLSVSPLRDFCCVGTAGALFMSDATLLETFPNPHPKRDYLIEHNVHEFTSVCPKTGQPDFAEIKITYIAAGKCVELKSLKLYLQGYRSEGIYYEDITNVILDDLVARCEPKWMVVETHWTVRGGINTVVRAEHGTSRD